MSKVNLRMSARTLEAFQFVEVHGIPSLVKAMKVGQEAHCEGMGIGTAYKIAQLPKAQQEEIMKEGAACAKRVVRSRERPVRKGEYQNAKLAAVRIEELVGLVAKLYTYTTVDKIVNAPVRVHQTVIALCDFVDRHVLKRVIP